MNSQRMIKEYSIFNKVMIILVIAMIFLPLIAILINKIFPFTYGCLSYRFLGSPCPLCGFTRDLRNIISGNVFAYKFNLISAPAVFLGVLELIGRIKLLRAKEKMINIKYRRNLIKFDIIYHLGIYLLFVGYVALFYIFDLSRLG